MFVVNSANQLAITGIGGDKAWREDCRQNVGQQVSSEHTNFPL